MEYNNEISISLRRMESFDNFMFMLWLFLVVDIFFLCYCYVYVYVCVISGDKV